MNPWLAPWIPADHNRQPPGLTWADWQPWQWWLAGPGRAWGAYSYDVMLHTQPLPATETDPAMLRMWARNTARRIDAVAQRGDFYDLFEARRFAGWSAIAQVMAYRDLWLFNFPALELGATYLIVEKIDDAVRALAARHDISTWAVGEGSPA